MKRSGLISLICSLVAVMVLCLSIVLVLIFTDVIRIVPEELIISSASASGTYDGEALTDQNWSLMKGELKKGHRLSVVVSGSQTNVGVSENYVFATVLDDNGTDVTEDYKIEYRPGALNVKARDITLTADSKMKVYDGEPLSADGFNIESSISLVSSHEIEVTVEGSITEVGFADNVITNVVIKNSRGEDVTKNYKIKAKNGTLAVYSEDTLIFETESDVNEYTGAALTNSNWKLASGKIKPEHRIVATVKGTQTTVGTSDNTISVVILNERGEDVSTNYEIVYNPGKLVVIPKKITIKAGSDQKVYDGKPLKCNDYTVSPDCIDKSYITLDITGSQTEIGTSENIASNAVIKDIFGIDVTSNYDITYISGELTVRATENKPVLSFQSFSSEKYYDGKALENPNWKLVEGQLQEGHTAQVVVTGSILDAGMTDNTFSVVIYDEMKNDVSDEYFINTDFGSLVVNKVDLTVTSDSAEKIFDGEPLTKNTYTLSNPSYGDKFIFDVGVIGQQTAVGSSPNTIAFCNVTDADNNNITRNFIIKKAEGVLTVVAAEEELKPTLIYSSGSSEKAYDGTPLANNECNRISGNLLEGHTELIEMTATLTEIGNIANTFKVTIFDGETDVTDKYNVVSKPGTLEVTPVKIKITTASDGKIYDGTALTYDSYEVFPPDAISPTHTLSVEVIGSITVPGVAENSTANYVITDENGNDVSQYYDVTVEKGELTVDKIPLRIESASDSKVYDGAPLVNHGYQVYSYDKILPVHILSVQVNGSITDPGKADNSMSIAIFDYKGNDVKDVYYDVTEVLGKLTVNNISIVVRANSAEKIYDGTPLTDSGFAILPGEQVLLPGHTVKAEVVGSRTEVGATENVVTRAWVEDEDGADVSTYYDISRSSGLLEVKLKTVYFTLDKGSANEYLHLKTESYGDYNKETNTWLAAPQYNLLTSRGYSAHHLFSIALQDYSEDGSMKKIEITPKQGIFALPYHTYTNDGTYKQTSDTKISGNGSGKYTVNYFTWQRGDYIELPGGDYKAFELEYREFVYDNYLYVDNDTLAFMKEFINEKSINKDASRVEIIEAVTKCIKTSARYNRLYNADLDQEDNVIIAFLSEYKEGVCSHYASAATMLFRALGIPARYTVGFAATTDSSGSAQITEDEAHAWVEVYIDGCGWEIVEVTGAGNSTDGSDKPKKLTVKIPSTSKKYDGSTLYPQQKITGLESLVKEGYRYEFEVGGANSALGITKSSVTQLQIYDPFNFLVYDKQAGIGTDKFIISYEDGELQNYIAVLTFGSNTLKKEYDGTPLVLLDSDCYHISGAADMYAGHWYEITATGTLDVVDVVDSNFNIVVYDENGNKCNDYYLIKKNTGTLQITERQITLKAKSASKAYDGTPLTCIEIDYDKNQLAQGDYIYSVDISSEITNIGEAANVIKGVVIKNKNGKVVTECYSLKFEDGKLTVTPP